MQDKYYEEMSAEVAEKLAANARHARSDVCSLVVSLDMSDSHSMLRDYWSAQLYLDALYADIKSYFDERNIRYALSDVISERG
jgi:hypothetical protein